MTLLTVTDLDDALNRISTQTDIGSDVEAIIHSVCYDSTLSSDLCIATILRLLNVNIDLVYSSLHRQHLLRLVLERLEEKQPRLLNDYNITNTTQADELCRHLAHIIEDAIDELNKAVSIYRGLDTLPRLRHRLLQTVNSARCKTAMLPFFSLGGDATELLNSSLGQVIGYLQADVYTAQRAFDQALDAVSSLLAALDTSPTHLVAPISSLFHTIKQDLREHSMSNPHLQPAQLHLDVDLRRHPLREYNLPITIPITLINDGKGTAANVEVQWSGAIGLRDLGPSIWIQSIVPSQMIIEMTARTDPDNLDLESGALCGFTIDWVNADGTPGHYQDEHLLKTQDTAVDWIRLTRSNPYSLDAVRDPDELVGRTQILNRIISTLATHTVGSLYIHGEKRVGKTSLAHVALKILNQDYNMETVFIDVGTIHDPEPQTVINKLSTQIIRHLNGDPRGWKTNYQPYNDGTLAPLIDYLESAVNPSPHKRIVVALDEFDRLPRRLLRRTTEGDNFFLGLRSLSNIDGVGLILIGAERMKLVTNAMGVELNRFRGFQVDYIDRSTQWTEFKELVQAPTKGMLEFTDLAYDRIYRYTEGNPYYTKHLCSKLLERAAQRRDAFIDDSDIEAGIVHLLGDIDATGFAHYWEDFVLGDEKIRDEVALNRRLCLLAYGQAADLDSVAELGTIMDRAAELGQPFEDTQRTIDEFVARRILTRSSNQSAVKPRVRLFGRWITGRGQDHITFGMHEHDSVRRTIELRRANRVTLHEARELTAGWSLYNGRRISSEQVLDYLSQFGDEYRQRLIFLLLKGLHFVGIAEEHTLLRNAYKILNGSMKERHGKWNLAQIAVSYAGSPAKSSNSIGRRFTKSTGLTVDYHFTSPRNLIGAADAGVTDVVVLDDFVGTGSTMNRELEKLRRRIAPEQVLHLFFLAAMADGIEIVESKAVEMFGSESINVHALQTLENYPWAFEDGAKLFPSSEMAQEARRVVEDFGRRLDPRNPLGYGQCCALIVFSETIPNNAPPILWRTSPKKPNFKPLFPRLV